MQNQKIAANFKNYVSITSVEIETFFELSERIVFEKNKFVTLAGEGEASFYLIESGCLMTYVTDDNNSTHVLQFGTDLWWTGDIEAIMNETPSAQTIKAVERTVAYKLTKEKYEKLLSSSYAYERYFRILFQRSLISHQKRIIRNISFTAEERYLAFIKQFPTMELLVAQKYIASYLGITPEFLSKLKKQMAKRV